MPDEKPQLGPWLRRYAEQDKTPAREKIREYAIAGAVAVAGLVVLGGVLLAFVRYPFPTLGILVLVWGVGYALYLVRRRRAKLEEQLRQIDLERGEKARKE
jgi:hypothetical protein